MARSEVIVGLDVGTSTIQAVVGEIRAEEGKPYVLGIGQAAARGMRRGVVVDIEEAISSIREARHMAERTSGIAIEEAYVSIGGSHISSRLSRGVIAVSRADGEISEDDIGRVIAAAEAVSLSPNREILHVIPRDFTVDAERGIKDPLGMSGVRLEVDALLVEASSPVLRNLTKCIEGAGVKIRELVLGVVAASQAVLSKRQRELGVLVMDIGGGTTDLSVFEEGGILHAAILPVGAGYITNDLAIGFRTSIDVAERLKIEYGTARAADIPKKEIIRLADLSAEEEGTAPRRMVAEIIEARLEEIFDLTQKELKAIGRAGMLPAGAVLVGGGAKLPGIVDAAKERLKLPIQIGFPSEVTGLVERVDDPSFATAVGLLLWGKEQELRGPGGNIIFPYLPSMAATVTKMKRWFKAFLP